MTAYPYHRVFDPLAIPSGALRNEIHIQQQGAAGIDSTGAPTATWTDLYVCFAEIKTISAREQFLNGQFASQVMYTMRFWWPGEIGIGAGMRVVFGQGLQHVGVIQAAENVQMRNRVITLLVQEIDGGQ